VAIQMVIERDEFKRSSENNHLPKSRAIAKFGKVPQTGRSFPRQQYRTATHRERCPEANELPRHF
jgi:hypothetical protein